MNKQIIVTLAFLGFVILAISTSSAGDHQNDQGYYDRDHYHHSYETYHHHRGYWQHRNGIQFFINVD